MPRSKSYRSLLIESLKNKDEAQSYLNAILEECTICEPEEAQKLLLLALKNITEAQGGFTQLSKSTGMARESLYKSLSAKGNPKLSTIFTVTNALLSKPR